MNKIQPKIIYYASLLLFIFSLIITLISMLNGVLPHHLFFNSDALYLATIHKSIFVEGFSFTSYKFPDAPFFFPDFLIFSIIFAVTKNYLLTNILTAWSILSMVFIVLYKIVQYLLPKRHYLKKSLLLSGFALLIALMAQNQLFLHIFLLISPVFHEGELLIVMLSLLIIFELVRKERVFLYPILFVLIALVTFSDKSVVKDFTAPFAIVVAVTYFLDKDIFKRFWKALVVIVLATFVGSVLYSIILPFPKSFPGIVTYSGRNFENMLNSFRDIASERVLFANIANHRYEFSNYLALFTIFIVFSLATVVFLLFKYLKKISRKVQLDLYEKRMLLFGLFILGQSILNFAATIFFGYYHSLVHTRYFTPMMIFPYTWFLIFTGVQLAKHLQENYLKYLNIAVIFLVVFVSSLFFTKINEGGLANYKNYKPPNSVCIDKIAKEHNLKYGLSELWNTVHTLFSDEDVILHQISSQGSFLEPSHWLTSYEWYVQKAPEIPEPPEYSFIVTEKFDTSKFDKVLGEPLYVYDCPETQVYVYDPQVIAPVVNGLFSSWYFFDRLDSVGDVVEIPGGQFEEMIFNVDENISLVERKTTPENHLQSADQEGLISSGPYVTLKKGLYKISLWYRTDTEDAGSVDIITSPPLQRTNFNLENTNDETRSFSGEVEIGKDIKKITINPYNVGAIRLMINYSGGGTLTIEKLVIERID